MKSGNDYPINTAIALLLGGETGTGKSTNLFNWPRPWIADLEGNLKGAIAHHTMVGGKPPEFKWDRPQFNTAGNLLPLADQYDRLVALADAAVADPAVSVICIDGLGKLCDMLKAKLANLPGDKPVTIAGQRVMGLAQWGVYGDQLKKFVWDLRDKGKPLIITCHLKVGENEMTNVNEYRIADLQADLGKSNSFPKCFSDYFQTLNEVVTKTPDCPRGVRYKLRTAPTTRNPSLKTSFPELPDEFVVGDECFKQLLAKVAPATVK